MCDENLKKNVKNFYSIQIISCQKKNSFVKHDSFSVSNVWFLWIEKINQKRKQLL